MSGAFLVLNMNFPESVVSYTHWKDGNGKWVGYEFSVRQKGLIGLLKGPVYAKTACVEVDDMQTPGTWMRRPILFFLTLMLAIITFPIWLPIWVAWHWLNILFNSHYKA